MRIAYLILVILFLFGTAACRNNTANSDSAAANLKAIAKANKDSVVLAKEQKLIGKLGGKELPCLNSIIPSLSNYETNIIFIISKFDCVSCVDAGYEILRRINNSNGVIKTYATGLTKEVGIPKDYKYPVYEDEKQELHASINYSPTPIILVLEGRRIIDLHTPEDAGSEHSRNFINEYMY